VIGEGATVWWGVAYDQPLPPFPLRLLAAPSAWAVGYLLGAVAAELTRRRPHPRQLRAAALAPRRLADYLPAWMLWAERAVAVAVLALVPLGSPGEPWAHSRGITTAVAAIAVVALVEVTLRVMVRRRQPVATTGELAIDDALRSTSIHRAAGAGLAALLFLLPSQLGNLTLGGPGGRSRARPAARDGRSQLRGPGTPARRRSRAGATPGTGGAGSVGPTRWRGMITTPVKLRARAWLSLRHGRHGG
jgi:hypothetical protein